MGYCGIDCKKCSNYVKPENRKITNRYRKNKNFKCESKVGFSYNLNELVIECYGCEYDDIWTNNVIFDFCNKCNIRKCATEKKINSCKECPDFLCEIYSEKISKDYNKLIKENK